MDPASLPSELFCNIASHLTIREYITCRRVSKTWQTLCSSPAYHLDKIKQQRQFHTERNLSSAARAIEAIEEGKPVALLTFLFRTAFTNEHVREPALHGYRLALPVNDKKLHLVDLVQRTYKEIEVPHKIMQVILTSTATGIVTKEALYADKRIGLPSPARNSEWFGHGQNSTFALTELGSNRVLVIKDKLEIFKPTNLNNASKAIIVDESIFLIQVQDKVMYVTEIGSTKVYKSKVPISPWNPKQLTVSHCGLACTWSVEGTILELRPGGIKHLPDQSGILWQEKSFHRVPLGDYKPPGLAVEVQGRGCLLQPPGSEGGGALMNAAFFISWNYKGAIRIYTFEPDLVRPEDRIVQRMGPGQIQDGPCWTKANYMQLYFSGLLPVQTVRDSNWFPR